MAHRPMHNRGDRDPVHGDGLSCAGKIETLFLGMRSTSIYAPW